jgi:hypothetical protein
MERHRCACSHPLPKTRHRQAAHNGQAWIARALIGTKPMPGRISREAADQSLSVIGTLARRVPHRFRDARLQVARGGGHAQDIQICALALAVPDRLRRRHPVRSSRPACGRPSASGAPDGLTAGGPAGSPGRPGAWPGRAGTGTAT